MVAFSQTGSRGVILLLLHFVPPPLLALNLLDIFKICHLEYIIYLVNKAKNLKEWEQRDSEQLFHR